MRKKAVPERRVKKLLVRSLENLNHRLARVKKVDRAIIQTEKLNKKPMTTLQPARGVVCEIVLAIQLTLRLKKNYLLVTSTSLRSIVLLPMVKVSKSLFGF